MLRSGMAAVSDAAAEHDGAAPRWPPGDGEMAARVREHDWSATPLGPVEGWPQSLRTAVGIVLGSGHAMQLAWGPERIVLYNDAYAPMLGNRHPGALGLPFPEAWPDIWEEIEPLVERVFAGGTVRYEDLPLVMTRSGYPEDTWWDFSYSPVRDEAGAVAGLLNVTVDATPRIRAARAEAALREGEERQSFLLGLSDALRPLADPVEIQRTATRMLGEHLKASRVFYVVVEGDGDTAAILGDYTDGVPSRVGRYSLSAFSTNAVGEWRAGRTASSSDVDRDPRYSEAEREAYASVSTRAGFGVPLIKEGRLVALLGVNQSSPRRWTGYDTDLAGEVAERTWAAVERARAEAALRQSEARFRALATAGSYMTYRMSPDWRRMHQLDGRDILADTSEPIEDWADAYILPEDRPLVFAAIAEVIRGKSMFELEHRVRLAGGGVGWVLSRAVPILGPDGEVVEWFGAASDATLRKRAEEQVRQGEELRRIALDGGGMGAWRWDLKRRLIWGDARFLALWGHPPSDGLHPLSSFTGRMSPEGAAEMEVIVTRAIEAGEEFDGPLEITSGPTAGHWIRWRGRAAADDTSVLYGVTFDITEQRRSEAAVRESEAKYRTLFENMTEGYAIGELRRDATCQAIDWRFIEFNPALQRHTGMDPAASTGRWFSDLFPGANRTYWLGVYQSVVDTQSVRTFEEYWPPLDRWLGGVASPADEGRFYILYRDVTDRKRQELALRASEERFRGFAENSADVLWIADSTGTRLEYLSPAFERTFGEPRERVMADLGRWAELVHPEDRGQALSFMPRAVAGEVAIAHYRVVRPADGRVVFLRDTGFPIHDAAGAVARVAGIVQDVSDLARAAERQQVLIAELQHRTRNLLGVVRSVARSSIPPSPGLDEYDARLAAFGRVQGFLSRSALYAVPLADLVQAELVAAGDGASEKVVVEGPPVTLPGEGIQTVALALHELATNAAKYGAIAQASGRLSVTWRVETAGEDGSGRLVIDWRESAVAMPNGGGPPARQGYGSELITEALPYQLGAETELEFGPDGVRCRIALPAGAFTRGEEEEAHA